MISGSILGVDVGFSLTRDSSAICRLDWSVSDVSWTIKRFRAIEPEQTETLGELAAVKPLAAAAFDGPLMRGFPTINRYRIAEQMLTRRLGRKIGKPGTSNVPVGIKLNNAANICAQIVKTHASIAPAAHWQAIDDLAIIEAFPSSFLGLMLSDPALLTTERNNRSDVYFEANTKNGTLQRLLTALLPNRRSKNDFAEVTNHDDRAALICALTALCVAMNDYTAIGDEYGTITLPPKRFIQPEYLEDLAVNHAEIGQANPWFRPI